MNGYPSSQDSLLVLYKIYNTDCDKQDDSFNAFSMPRPGSKGPTLQLIKQ